MPIASAPPSMGPVALAKPASRKGLYVALAAAGLAGALIAAMMFLRRPDSTDSSRRAEGSGGAPADSAQTLRAMGSFTRSSAGSPPASAAVPAGVASGESQSAGRPEAPTSAKSQPPGSTSLAPTAGGVATATSGNRSEAGSPGVPDPALGRDRSLAEPSRQPAESVPPTHAAESQAPPVRATSEAPPVSESTAPPRHTPAPRSSQAGLADMGLVRLHVVMTRGPVSVLVDGVALGKSLYKSTTLSMSLKPGRHTLRVQREDEVKERSIVVQAGDSTRVDFVLSTER